MFENLPLFPPQASTMAPRVDALLYFLSAVSIFFASVISIAIVVFAVKYRRRPGHETGVPIEGDIRLEILWSVVPLGIVMVMFYWGAVVFLEMTQPPANALELNVVGRQWMWKIQHPQGQSEINELHVPLGQPVKLIMASEDVVHSFFIPAFRTKLDVVPGRYSTIWFQPTRAGEYHMFCAEYCGTLHSGMIGRVVVMEPAEYQQWLGEGASTVSITDAGAQLFERLGCAICHRPDGKGQGPALAGRFGKTVKLQDGRTVTVDEGYLRESILNPNAKITAGYPPVMPTFKGLIDEQGIMQIIAYLKSLPAQERAQVRP
jgi:cytochrome c oxidase subunit II